MDNYVNVSLYKWNNQGSILDGNSDFWFRFLGPLLETEFRFCFWFRRFRSDFFLNSDVLKVKKLEFRFAKFGIPVMCLCRNSLRLFVANLYWLQSMYNDLILMVHKLGAPQHQTAYLGGTTSCYLMALSMKVMLRPAILDRWCNLCHWCASGKKQGRSLYVLTGQIGSNVHQPDQWRAWS